MGALKFVQLGALGGLFVVQSGPRDTAQGGGAEAHRRVLVVQNGVEIDARTGGLLTLIREPLRLAEQLAVALSQRADVLRRRGEEFGDEFVHRLVSGELGAQGGGLGGKLLILQRGKRHPRPEDGVGRARRSLQVNAPLIEDIEVQPALLPDQLRGLAGQQRLPHAQEILVHRVAEGVGQALHLDVFHVRDAGENLL